MPARTTGESAITHAVGFIGLGTMGKPMAANIARAAGALVVHDRRTEPYADLQALGAHVAASPAKVAAVSEIVHVNVVNDAQVREVLLGDEGVLAALTPGSMVVVHSTVHPRTCQELEAAANALDIGFLDAPFSGGLAGAERGTLTFMVGGRAEVLQRARSVLELMGDAIFHVGGAGMGEVAKIANNAVLSVVLQGTTESLRLAREAGIEEATMLSILCASAGDSWVTRNWTAIEQVTANYPGGARGMGDLIYKDLSIALSLAHELRTELPVTALTSQLVEQPYARPSSATH